MLTKLLEERNVPALLPREEMLEVLQRVFTVISPKNRNAFILRPLEILLLTSVQARPEVKK